MTGGDHGGSPAATARLVTLTALLALALAGCGWFDDDIAGGDAAAGERPQADEALAEAQREELSEQIEGSQLEVVDRLGSELERIEELESRYDATETEQGETQLTVPDHVLFDFDSDELRPDASRILDEIAEVIAHYADAPVAIHGHTDSIGDAGYNQALSERRAAAVETYLGEEAGVDPDRLTSQGFGQSEPVAPNTGEDGSDNPEGRAQNRRVEVLIDD